MPSVRQRCLRQGQPEIRKAGDVPGFRKGYAPLDVVRLRYKEEIKSEVLQEIVPG